MPILPFLLLSHMPLNQKAILPEQARLGLVNAQAQDFVCVFQKWLGDLAEEHGIEILARYRYTPDYATWAVGIHKTPDDVAIEGDGLELLVNPNPQDLGSDQFQYNYRWRILVKDHSASQNKIHPTLQIVKTYLFPFISSQPYLIDEQLQIEQAVWRVDISEVPTRFRDRRRLP